MKHAMMNFVPCRAVFQTLVVNMTRVVWMAVLLLAVTAEGWSQITSGVTEINLSRSIKEGVFVTHPAATRIAAVAIQNRSVQPISTTGLDAIIGKLLRQQALDAVTLAFEPSADADPGFRLSGLAPTVRANVNTNLDLAGMSVAEILQAGGAALFSRVTAADGFGNIGRNVLRSNGIKNVDFGLVKNTRISRIGETARLQFRAEFYNLTNTRNFGIPEGRVSSANFLNQWGTDGGNRRIVAAIRFVF